MNKMVQEFGVDSGAGKIIVPSCREVEGCLTVGKKYEAGMAVGYGKDGKTSILCPDYSLKPGCRQGCLHHNRCTMTSCRLPTG